MSSEVNLEYRLTIGLNVNHELHKCTTMSDHPEDPKRIKGVIEYLKKVGIWERCNVIEEHPSVEKGDLLQTHSEDYVDFVKSVEDKSEDDCSSVASQFDSVHLCPGSWNSSINAVACVRNLSTLIIEEKIPNAVALVRPPGHHAQRNQANGFCIFNNVAQAAEAAYDFGAERTLIVDFDVHHGQGIQEAFYEDKRVLYFSIHRYENGKYWPHLRESDFDYIGDGIGTGFNINVPLNEVGCGDGDYMAIFWNVLWPVARDYDPHMVIVAAGFDACEGDPLGEMAVSPDLFAHFIYHLSSLAGGKMLLCLEGGYNVSNLSVCVERCARVLLKEPPKALPPLNPPKQSTVNSCLDTISALLPHWACFDYYAISGTPHLFWEVHNTEVIYEPPPEQERRNTGSIDQFSLPECSSKPLPEFLGRLTAIAYDRRVELHEEEGKGVNHIECPQRTFVAAIDLQERGLFDRCILLSNRDASSEDLELVHERPHVMQMKRLSEAGPDERRRCETFFDSVYFCSNTFLAASAAVGSVLQCVHSVMGRSNGNVQTLNAFALVRPPGHHASISRPYGFCIFNNVAIAAKYALEKYNLKRVLIVDWDVHHGNGIQEVFYDDPQVLYISLHRHEEGAFFPMGERKDVQDVGEEKGIGFTVNIPFSHGRMVDSDYLMAFSKIVMPIAYEFSPELVFIASGFDAGEGDPLGSYKLTPQCFAQLTYQLSALANGRVIACLEGGYNLTTVSAGVQAVVSTFLDGSVPPRSIPLCSVPLSDRNCRQRVHSSSWDTMRRVCDFQSAHWKCLAGFQRRLNILANDSYADLSA